MIHHNILNTVKLKNFAMFLKVFFNDYRNFPHAACCGLCRARVARSETNRNHAAGKLLYQYLFAYVSMINEANKLV